MFETKGHMNIFSCEQEVKLKDLDKLTSESKTSEENAKENEEFPPEQNASPQEIRRINQRIGDMLDQIRKQRVEIKKMRREAGRLEACLRVRKKSASGSRRVQPRLEDVKERASSGGILTIEDLGALLKGGGLSKLTEIEPVEKTDESEKETKPRKRKARAKRGQQRSRSEEERERRRG